jgi:hypothetical protein
MRRSIAPALTKMSSQYELTSNLDSSYASIHTNKSNTVQGLVLSGLVLSYRVGIDQTIG